MPDRTPRFAKDQIGINTVRYPSGAPMPSITDASVDPYIKTRIPKEAQVEGLLFGPQDKGPFPGVILLHEAWGLNTQIQDMARRLAQEGFIVLVPNLYGRQGGMVTANAEIAEALAGRANPIALLQDVTSGCEFLNSRDYVKRNVHGVVGLDIGGSLAIRLACHRKRLKAAVSFYSRPPEPASILKDLACPLLYHQAGADSLVPAEAAEILQQAAKDSGKPVEIRRYEQAPHGFMNETRADTYRPEAAAAAWETTIQFLNDCFK